MTCEDFGLPSHVATLVTKQIQEQLSEHKTSELQQLDVLDLTADDQPMKGFLEGSDETFWEQWRKRLRIGTDGEFVRSGKGDDSSQEDDLRRKNIIAVKEEEDFDKPLDVSKLPQVNIKRDTELRIMIKVSAVCLGYLSHV